MSYYVKFLGFIGIIVILLAAGIFFFMHSRGSDLERLIYDLAEAANRGDSAAICSHIPDNYNYNGYDARRMKDLVRNYLGGIVEKVEIKKVNQSTAGTLIRTDVDLELTFSAKTPHIGSIRTQPMFLSIKWENRDGTWFITGVDTNRPRR